MSETYGGSSAGDLRQIHPSWNPGLVIASIAVSLLGAFTSTQLMCQARVSRTTLATVVWTFLASLTFGFCSIWSLHFVAMLACELDIPIGLNAGLTVLSAILAVMFTFLALASETVWENIKRQRRRGKTRGKKKNHSLVRYDSGVATLSRQENAELLRENERNHEVAHRLSEDSPFKISDLHLNYDGNGEVPEAQNAPISPYTDGPYTETPAFEFDTPDRHPSESPMGNVYDPQRYLRLSLESDRGDTESMDRSSTSESRRSSGFSGSDSSFGLDQFTSFRTVQNKAIAGKSLLEGTAVLLWIGLTRRNLTKGFIWSLAITLMHYLGIMSMRIPQGFYELNAGLVVLSAIICWIVCVVGCVLMASMESKLSQQFFFAAVASSGVAAMHYTGMAATTFHTEMAPSKVKGYPASLPVAIASIAIVTCLAANGLLAHSATVARNKLAEIVRTRRKLWAAIAQKENAEAAAIARSEFIASASHEIRTPLHQLQGYSDLLARCPLPEDARLLLFAIQDATKTLSLITNNVLDWSRLEKGEAVCRPSNLDIRAACDSIVKLLPRRDDDLEVELLVVVSPEVPKLILLDETYLHRIAMNLVSNALKFTTSGYVSLSLEIQDSNLVITVADTGIGIPTSFLPDLFEPFKQAQTRGAERGTGLGLSIVKQLLEKIGGDIQTESKHRDAEGVGATKCGTKFVVRMPVDVHDIRNGSGSNHMLEARQTLALFGMASTRTVQGMKDAWDKFGMNVLLAKDVDSLAQNVHYACVDIKSLQQDTALKQALSRRKTMTVLVPYDTENHLFTVLGSVPPTHFVPMRRPWIFHNIIETLREARLHPNKSDIPRTVRFASEVDVLSGNASAQSSEPNSGATSQVSSPDIARAEKFGPNNASDMYILLVEDNKINQKLGAKMLKTLGYNVLLAADGQESTLR